MKKLSKLTALLLALMLLLAAPLTALAEAIDTESEYEQQVSVLLELLYNTILQTTTYEEILAATETMTRTEIVNFLDRLLADSVVADEFAQYDEHILELFATYLESRTIPITRDYTNVGPFLNYVTSADSTASTASLYVLPRAVVTEPGTGSAGLVSTKTVNWNEANSTGTITLEAYATGSKVTQQTTISPPLDIILIVDQSGSMTESGNKMPVYDEVAAEDLDKDETYYIADGVYWRAVSWCETCQAWTSCEHVGTETTVAWSYSPDDYEFFEPTTNTMTRKAALKPAVQEFVTLLNQKASGADGEAGTADDAYHRLAIIGFNSASPNARLYRYDTSARYTSTTSEAFIALNTAAGQTEATNIVNNSNEGQTSLWYTKSGGTPTSAATQLAYDVFNNSSNDLTNADLDGNGQVDEYEKRQRVVILFTDGGPTDTAADAVVDAYNMKHLSDGAATIYTIGVIDGADPTLDFTKTTIKDSKSDADVNAYLHFISSNYPDQQNMNESSYDADKNLQGYYLAAASSGALKSIFRQIAGNINSSGSISTTLDETSSVVDVVTDYFQLPDLPVDSTATTVIRVYTANCIGVTGTGGNATYSFDTPVLDVALTAEANANISGNTVTVDGFNYSENWCGTETALDGSITVRGKKLIIEVDIIPSDDFIGGNSVVTNGTGSGIYANQEGITDPVMTWAEPKVDVFVNTIDPTVITQDLNIHLSNAVDITEAVLDEGTYKTVSGGDTLYVVNGVANAYVELVYAIYDKDDETPLATFTIPAGAERIDNSDGTVSWLLADGTTTIIDWVDASGETTVITDLMADADYRVICTATPINDGLFEPTTGEADAHVNVYKPVLTFQDSEVSFNEVLTDPTYFNGTNYVSTDWKHGDTLDTAVTMIGDAPTLTLDYVYADTDLAATETTGSTVKVVATTHIPVGVTVAIGGTDVTSHCSFLHVDCPFNGCPYGTEDEPPEFYLHLGFTTMTITKTGMAKGESAIFAVQVTTSKGEQTIMVSIPNDGTVTIGNLVVGSGYTVTESGSWTWKYTPAPAPATGTIDGDPAKNHVAITNTGSDKWLNDEAGVKNDFSNSSVTKIQ